jgi:Methyltransferase domain
VDFAEFVLRHLPDSPGRVLEVGCGEEGGVTPALAAAGFEPLAIDPRAPAGRWYRRVTLEELDDRGPFVAAVCGRVLHHVKPLGPALDRLARLAPVLVADEFSWDRIDDRARHWYEARYRDLVAEGHEPPGPPDLDEWRDRHDHLHVLETLRDELASRYDERVFQPRPYLCRWLGDAASEQLESRLIAAGALRAIGWRYVGERR